ncbi:Uncharacterised protein [Raoultella terrigena]|uniref:Uncharacterized protein n=1 Tax=Raoultella terrigena TaxID=577 RepID=A0A3P8IXW9_RAOTE|nr:Uncharacterised protein [Raoultella terrigena]
MLSWVLNSFLTNVSDLVTKKIRYIINMTTGIKSTTKNKFLTEF